MRCTLCLYVTREKGRCGQFMPGSAYSFFIFSISFPRKGKQEEKEGWFFGSSYVLSLSWGLISYFVCECFPSLPVAL